MSVEQDEIFQRVSIFSLSAKCKYFFLLDNSTEFHNLNIFMSSSNRYDRILKTYSRDN